MSPLEFYIAHEYENPTNIFFYQPVKVTANLIKAKILDNRHIDFRKKYYFYLNLNGLNFALIAQPIREDKDREFLFLIKDSKIELRKYPRLKTERLNIKVSVDGLEGILLDISIGGCKVGFETPIPTFFYEESPRKVLIIEPPDGKSVKIPAYIVNVNQQQNTISFRFLQKSEKILNLYTKISEYLKRTRKGLG